MNEGMNDTGTGGYPFYFVGNLPCLDFVNTEIVARGSRVDLLAGFADLVRWLLTASLLTPPEARAAAKRWQNTVEGKAVFKEAVSLRKALRAMAERLAAGKPADRTSIEPIVCWHHGRHIRNGIERE
jgi:hypothetical protein